MNCTQARETMLVAEPSELRGRGESPLSAHVGECDACRSLAGSLIGDMNVLSSRVRVRATRRTVMFATVPIAAVLVAVITLVSSRRDQPAIAAHGIPIIRRTSCRSTSASGNGPR